TGLWVITSLGANAERLVEVDLRTGGMDVVSEDPLFDVTGLLINPVRNTLEAVRYERERMAWVFLDDSIRGDFALLAGIGEGDISIRSRDSSDTGWLVRFSAPNRPTAYYHFDRGAKTIAFLFSEDPALETESLAIKNAIDFVATDGMTIYGYLTLPVGVEPRDLPLVVYVHGGPWTRDSWELDFPVQWLANRGYAVLQVNFRGSTGYGKAYQNAGNLEWGGKAVQDLVDGKNWAVMQGIADPRRVAVMGGSYGGYATLAALTFWPGEFACGVAMKAISDANLFMNSMPHQWTVARGRFEVRMGKDPEFLTRISPLHKANQVMGPLFIIHNANDVRVRQEHADLMVAALRALGKDVTFMVLPDAGHTGGAGSSNLMRRWAAIETFLGKHLGGRIEAPNNAEKWEPLLR
ncbi:MAG: S9 family peptidase, partial [Candidatus Eisenbacteria bacterium]|nr:S9 family peptidase [Candidatus Eisenbacteria bacterium]